MEAVNLLRRIQALWLQRAIHQFSRYDDDLDATQSRLEGLFNTLIKTLESDNSTELRKTINEWLVLRKNSQLEFIELTFVEILIHLQTITFETAEEGLSNREFVYLIKTSLPIFSEAIRYASHLDLELKLHLDRNTKELEHSNHTIKPINKIKSDFISIAAHELKTPLTLIEGYASMLQDQLDELNIFDHVAVFLRGIDKGTARLREIVNDMIDVSMIDNEMLALNFQPVWINRLFPLIEQEFSIKANARKQTLELKSLPQQHMTYADEEKLFKALCNIVSNAIKFTPDGGKITVGGTILPGFIEFTITDTGIGIDPQNHKKIFEKFSNLGKVSLHSSGKTKFKGGGPGLGLPITKGIINAHGGEIWVESVGYDEIKCPGTTFHVLIPLIEQAPDEEIVTF